RPLSKTRTRMRCAGVPCIISVSIPTVHRRLRMRRLASSRPELPSPLESRALPRIHVPHHGVLNVLALADHLLELRGPDAVCRDHKCILPFDHSSISIVRVCFDFRTASPPPP